ncbi:MAG: VWA domain-containing protein [Chloroflexi bacterium]|nr:VWA domain-containing protein [Chloroflexota bacterium]
MRTIITTLLFIFMLVAVASPALATQSPTAGAGTVFQIARGVYIKSHRVDVEITDQIAKTRVTQVFVNDTDFVAEGTYVFPLPPGVTISDLEMIIDGEPIQAKILEKDEARRIYDEIVRQIRDPALLEYVGSNAIQANVFPIPPGDQRTLEIEFNQLLTVEDGLVNYVYPLRTDYISDTPVQDLSIRVSVDSNDPIGNIYSPTHRIAIDRQGENAFVAGFETVNAREQTDFRLYYGIATDEVSMNLLTYKESANEDGYFVALVSPPVAVAEDRIIPKDVIIVLDNSGSMFGNKWDQAVEATKFVLDNLNAEDRFNVITFSTGVRVYAPALQGISEVTEARDWISGIEAIGGTNINEALLTALQQTEGERQTVILFLTDGLATEGVVETADILKNFEDGVRDNISVFTFGVGDDVDTFLLDQLSDSYSGASAYVRPMEAIDEEVGSLYNKIRAPLLTDILLEVEGVDIYDVYPASDNIPDLFIGTQLVIVGRYSGSAGNGSLSLKGKVDGENMSFVYENHEFRQNAGGEELIPRLWATRRIGDLLNTIRLNGENPELVDSIVRLSIRYGIITPYTSFLITEDDIFTQTGRTEVLQEAEDSTSFLDDEASGEGAIEASESSRNMRDADVAQAPGAPADGFGGGYDGNEEAPVGANTNAAGPAPIQIAGDRTFVMREGKWIDTTYDADTMETIEIEFLSDEYFNLLDQDERVAEFYAMGESVIFVLDGQAYEIVPAE